LVRVRWQQIWKGLKIGHFTHVKGDKPMSENLINRGELPRWDVLRISDSVAVKSRFRISVFRFPHIVFALLIQFIVDARKAPIAQIDEFVLSSLGLEGALRVLEKFSNCELILLEGYELFNRMTLALV